MAIYSSVPKSDGTDFIPAPEGTQQGVCVDVVDYGVEEVDYEGKVRFLHRIRFVWESSEKMEDGRPFLIRSRKYNNSLHENAALRKDLVAWRGRDFTKEQLDKFDLETVLGANCLLNVVHTTVSKNGFENTYANVASIMPLPKKTEVMKPSGGYTRMCNRPDWKAPSYDKPTKAQNGSNGNGSANGNGKAVQQKEDEPDELPF